jgi:hypothetical protein
MIEYLSATFPCHSSNPQLSSPTSRFSMSIQIIPASLEHVPQMCDVGHRAFAEDGLHNALFPAHLSNPENPNALVEAQIESMQKRIQRSDTRYAVAIQDAVEGKPRVLGYVAFLIPSNAEDEADKEKPETAPGDPKFPKTLDVRAYKYATEVMERAKKEILKEQEKNTWRMLMTSIFSKYHLKFSTISNFNRSWIFGSRSQLQWKRRCLTSCTMGDGQGEECWITNLPRVNTGCCRAV